MKFISRSDWWNRNHVVIKEDIEEAVTTVEKENLFTFEPVDIHLVLLSAFYVFNMHCTEGWTNFFSALSTLEPEDTK